MDEGLQELIQDKSNLAGTAGFVLTEICAVAYTSQGSGEYQLLVSPLAVVCGMAAFGAVKYGYKAIESAQKNVKLAIAGVAAVLLAASALAMAANNYAAPVNREAAYFQHIDATLRTRLKACNYFITGESISKRNSDFIGTLQHSGLLAPSTEVKFLVAGEKDTYVLETIGQLVAECEVQQANSWRNN